MLNFEGFSEKPNKITFLVVSLKSLLSSLLSSEISRIHFLSLFQFLNNSRIGKNTTLMGFEFIGNLKVAFFDDMTSDSW